MVIVQYYDESQLNHGSEGIQRMVADGSCISMTECWHDKPTFGMIGLLRAPFFLSSLLPYQRTTDSNDNFGYVIRISMILIPVCTRLIWALTINLTSNWSTLKILCGVWLISCTHLVIHTLVGPPMFHHHGSQYYCFPPIWRHHCKNNMQLQSEIQIYRNFYQLSLQCHLLFVEEAHNQLQRILVCKMIHAIICYCIFFYSANIAHKI